MNIARTIWYTGPYMTLDGKKHDAMTMLLEYIDQDASDSGNDRWVDAAPPNTSDGEENIVQIDLQLWTESICENTGGHNYVDHQWSEKPESACQICTRCGSEVDPA